jgi:hypothetical protein
VASGSLALAAVGTLLSVFGVADLILALVERIELKPPDPGPSNVPRVKWDEFRVGHRPAPGGQSAR